jgi:hypothetical protein
MLHDMGKVALDAVLPKSFSKVVEAADLLRGNIADLERTVIGLDHMVVGKRLAEKWQLPATIRDCIWLHGQLPQALPATVKNPRMVNLTTLADLLVREQHLGYSGNYVFAMARQVPADAVGIGNEQVEAVMQKLVATSTPSRRPGAGQASTSELYQHALARANKELGESACSFPATISYGSGEILRYLVFRRAARRGAPVVLHAIGQTAVSTLDVTNARFLAAARTRLCGSRARRWQWRCV